MASKLTSLEKIALFVHKKSGSGSLVARDSRGSFRDTAKAISQIKSGLPGKVFFALKGQLNIGAEELAHIVGIAPRTLLRRKQVGCKKRNRSASFDCGDYLIRRSTFSKIGPRRSRGSIRHNSRSAETRRSTMPIQSWAHVKWRTSSAASNTECSFDGRGKRPRLRAESEGFDLAAHFLHAIVVSVFGIFTLGV